VRRWIVTVPEDGWAGLFFVNAGCNAGSRVPEAGVSLVRAKKVGG